MMPTVHTTCQCMVLYLIDDLPTLTLQHVSGNYGAMAAHSALLCMAAVHEIALSYAFQITDGPDHRD